MWPLLLEHAINDDWQVIPPGSLSGQPQEMSDMETRLCPIQVITDRHLATKTRVKTCSVLDLVARYRPLMVPDEGDLDIWPPSGMVKLAALKAGSVCWYIHYMKGTLYKKGLLFVQWSTTDTRNPHAQCTPVKWVLVSTSLPPECEQRNDSWRLGQPLLESRA